MHGNVAEWCLDWWSTDLGTGPAFDPIGPEKGGERVLRGGSWSANIYSGHAVNCRSGYRSRLHDNYTLTWIDYYGYWGFRLAVADPEQKEPVDIIFDTDMGPDFDDVGALGILNQLADRGEARILAVGVCNRATLSLPSAEIINAWYGRPEVPVGIVDASGKAFGGGVQGNTSWAVALTNRYPNLWKTRTGPEGPDAVKVFRKALAAAADGSVTFCTVGFLTNLSRLLDSPGDDISPLDGKALVAKKAKLLVSIAGEYPRGSEWNIRADVKSAIHAFGNWPTPVVYDGYEIGNCVTTGKRLVESPFVKGPVKDVYTVWRHIHPHGRMSWDQTGVLAAVRGPERYFGTVRGRAEIAPDGKTRWIPDPRGRDRVLIPKTPWTELEKTIEDLMMAPGKYQVGKPGPVGKVPTCGRGVPDIRRFELRRLDQGDSDLRRPQCTCDILFQRKDRRSHN